VEIKTWVQINVPKGLDPTYIPSSPHYWYSSFRFGTFLNLFLKDSESDSLTLPSTSLFPSLPALRFMFPSLTQFQSESNNFIDNRGGTLTLNQSPTAAHGPLYTTSSTALSPASGVSNNSLERSSNPGISLYRIGICPNVTLPKKEPYLLSPLLF
jgi:hypothetical protein